MVSSAVIKSDGGARGNPGPAGAAFVIEDENGTVITSGGRYIGEATNNVAEYEGLLLGLEAAAEAGISDITVQCDSELIVKQINGQYRVKHANLKPLHARAQLLLRNFRSVRVMHIRREENVLADALVNEAIDMRSCVGDEKRCAGRASMDSLF